MDIQPLGPALGATVTGVDLTQPLSADRRDALHAALLAHQVLFFENQPVTPEQQRALAAQFGPLHIHPVYRNIPGVKNITSLGLNVFDILHHDKVLITKEAVSKIEEVLA